MAAKLPQLQTLGAFIQERYEPWARDSVDGGQSATHFREVFAHWFEEPLVSLNAWRIESWRRDRLEEGVPPAELDRQLQALDSCLRQAVDWQVIDRSPLQDLWLNIDAEFLVELFAGGVGHAFLREGWSPLGINDTWTTGNRAIIEMPGVSGDADYSIKIHIAGIFRPAESSYHRINVIVNDNVAGQIICRGQATYEFFAPARILKSRSPLQVILELPDASRPIDYPGMGNDIRFLALRMAKIELRPIRKVASPLIPIATPQPAAVTALLDHRAAMQELESLGINCEFGFVQRSVGAEPMGLFRWTHAPLKKLITALEKRLVGLDSRDALKIEVNDATEFLVEDRVYGFRHHSFVFESQGGTRERVKRNEFLRIGLLSRALIEELTEHSKLFVYHDAGKSTLAEIRDLVRVLNTYGKNTLLWMVSTADPSQVGTAHHIEPGLIEGYVSGFQSVDGGIAPTSPHHPSWLSAAYAAHGIWRTILKS